MGLTLPLSLEATFVASLSWTGKTRLRVEEFAPNDAAAKASADSVSAILNLARSAENETTSSDADADLKALLDSAHIEQHKNLAVLTATIPSNMLQKLVSTPVDVQNAPESRDRGSDKELSTKQ